MLLAMNRTPTESDITTPGSKRLIDRLTAKTASSSSSNKPIGKMGNIVTAFASRHALGSLPCVLVAKDTTSTTTTTES
ncbi:hypothetical protein ZHAS_00019004 [Anopheles sinensis]|uniref:Uncharacterized protein n=1 Tax=Anopheles sinensis TaxID=74873 RepID=A0A084WL68_ANOSI|nr:hypothetical protein ZHAS_00019004 [Anopheles sinensis]